MWFCRVPSATDKSTDLRQRLACGLEPSIRVAIKCENPPRASLPLSLHPREQMSSAIDEPTVARRIVTPPDSDEKRDRAETASLPSKNHHDLVTAVPPEHDLEDPEAEGEKKVSFYQRYRPFILAGIAIVILGWWISATVLPATRHRWYTAFARLKKTCTQRLIFLR